MYTLSGSFNLPSYANVPPFANQQVDEIFENMRAEYCQPNQLYIPNSLANDIVGVTYSSDGQKLILTFWFKDMVMVKNSTSLMGKPVIVSDRMSVNNFDGSYQNTSRLNEPYREALNILGKPVIVSDRMSVNNFDGSYQNITHKNMLRNEASRLNETYHDAADTLKDISKIFNGASLNETTGYLQITEDGENATLKIYKDPVINSNRINATLELKSAPQNSQLYMTILSHLFSNTTKVTSSIGYDVGSLIKSISQDYRMFVDINSIYDTGWDYISSASWNSTGHDWEYTVKQVGPASRERNISEETNSSGISLSIHKNFVDSIMNLSALSYPDDLTVLFQMDNKIATTTLLCDFYDRTNFITVPPPKINLNAKPNSLNLLPDEKAKLLLTVNSSTNLPANVTFNITPAPGIEISEPIPQNVTIPPNGIATSELEVRPKSADIQTRALQLNSTISFLTLLEIRGKMQNVPPKAQVVETTYIPITVKEPKGPFEQISEGVDNGTVLLSKASGFVTAVGIIATGFLTLFAFLRRMGRHKSKSEPPKRSPV